MAKKKSAALSTFLLSIKASPRMLTEHLGRQKYATPAKAIAELIMNGFDADAKRVDVDLHRNALGMIAETIEVSDNGVGMTEWDLKHRFQEIGVTAKADGKQRLGQFGVGRMAVFRLGSRSKWETVSIGDDKKRTRYSFTLESDHPDSFEVKVEAVSDNTPTGTRILIDHLVDEQTQRLTDKALAWDLFSEFASYLFAWGNKRLRINGDLIDVNERVMSRGVEEIGPDVTGVPHSTKLEHLILKSPVVGSRVPEQLILTAKGVAVERLTLSNPPSPHYLALVSSRYLDKMVAENRAAFINMDGGIVGLKNAVDRRIESFGDRYRRETADEFIDRARQNDYYPYKGEPDNAVTRVEQQLYDNILTLVNDAVNVENLGKKHQGLIFDLLHRALRDENLLEVLGKIADLSTQDVVQFRELLERTTLQSIIRLASEVTDRLTFLDVLNQIVYGDSAKHLLERTQLHKYLESHCWIFGPHFHLATSDKGFRTVVDRQRVTAGLDPLDEDTFNEIAGIDQIPDLYLATKRDYQTSDGHRHEHLMVEIKRPSKKVDSEVVGQGERYASVLNACAEFDNTKTTWDLYLVSTLIDDKIVNQKRRKGDRPFGFIDQIGCVRIWAFTWGEIIGSARDEMKLVRDRLETKSLELSASEYLQKKHPHVAPLTVPGTT
jgi:hypothetical protein